MRLRLVYLNVVASQPTPGGSRACFAHLEAQRADVHHQHPRRDRAGVPGLQPGLSLGCRDRLSSDGPGQQQAVRQAGSSPQQEDPQDGDREVQPPR